MSAASMLAPHTQTPPSNVTFIHAGTLLDRPGQAPRAASTVIVRGGRIDSVAGTRLFAVTEIYSDSIPSTLKICGGQFGYSEEGTGMFIDGNTSLEVRGAGLTYSGGRLIGTLQDGSSIDVALAFGPSWSGTFNLVTVATPSTPNC